MNGAFGVATLEEYPRLQGETDDTGRLQRLLDAYMSYSANGVPIVE